MGRMYSRWYQGQLIVYPGIEGPGEEWFVDSTSGADTNTGKDWENALATLDAAVNKCTASNGDTIYVAPFHTEALAADSAVDVDLAGISIVGVRRGREMPTLNYTDPDGDLKLAAANCSIRNIRFTGGVDIGTGCIEVAGADCAIIDCEFRDVTGQATDVVMILTTADRCLIDGYRHIGAAAGGGDSAISIDGADDVEIRNFEIYGNFAVGAIDFRTTASARAKIHGGSIWTENVADIAIVDTITASTGVMGPNLLLTLQDDAANITNAITGATFYVMDVGVHVVNAVAEKSMAINWTASTHA